MKNPNASMLLRIAQADACGMAVEFIKPEHEATLNEALRFERYVKHPFLSDVKPGMYTDDTQMSCAVASALIERNNPSVLDFAACFLQHYKRDQRGGYSPRVRYLLECAQSPEGLLRYQSMSDFNGAAMRAVPVGVLSDPTLIKHVAAKQALPTHDSPGGVLSAQFVSLMSHFSLHTDLPFNELCTWLQAYMNKNDVENICAPWHGRVTVGHNKPGMGLLTVRAVHTLLVECSSLIDMMKRLMLWGGDTDSVAAIAWGIASARFQDEKLPEFMERDLELGSAYGVSFLKEIGSKLMEKYA